MDEKYMTSFGDRRSQSSPQKTTEKYKDTFFRTLFKEKQRAIELCNAIAGTDYKDDVDFQLCESNPVVAEFNDLAFIVKGELIIMCEHQSSLNPNMPLRLLLYLSDIIRTYAIGNEALYSTKLIKIPAPKFFVMYNGKAQLKYKSLKMSNAYIAKEKGFGLELIAQMVDINYENAKAILSKSQSLKGYSTLVGRISAALEAGFKRDQAIKIAVDLCIKEGVLAEYLQKNYKGVLDMLNNEYDRIQWIDGVPYKLKEPFDFSFIRKYGRVFKIFDEQSSGCICFGVIDGERKYFIKFAGVRTINDHDLPVSDAIARLKAAVIKYKELAHPLLINLIEAKSVNGGYMMVFDWYDGESFSVEKPELHEKFSALPITQKIYVFEEILRFHEHVAKCGYVAMDFNDYSTLYNFDSGKVKICDIDFYAKQSYINGMGKALGDPTVMSPEEFRIGGLVDEISNVYTMGATAFVLFSNNDRSPEAWRLLPELYAVVKKAVSDERGKRQQSIEQFIEEWQKAKESI